MTTDDCKEWSCGTCTFLNKPLFLSCEMCGQARPSQRPCPPRRQPSLPVDRTSSERNSSSSRGGGGRDRAPRSVQRHRSTVNITGTLIMTDDPADYETQDGKKPGEDDDEAEQENPTYEEPRSREDDPTLDESMERHMLEPVRPTRSTDSGSSGRSSNNDAHHSRGMIGGGVSRNNSNDSASMEFPPRRHQTTTTTVGAYQTPQQLHQHHQAPPSTRKAYNTGGNSVQTLPTAYMGSSSRLQLEDSTSFADDVSSLSSGRSSRFHHGGMGNSSRRLVGAGVRPRLGGGAPQEIHYHGRSSNGLPVITREPATPNRYQHHPHHQRRASGNGGLMGDTSINSVYSEGSSYDSNSVKSPITPRSTRRPSMGMGAASSMRHINPHVHNNNMSNSNMGGSTRSLVASSARRGASVRDLPNQGDFIESVLPSLAPPPVPSMDSPGDVDVMAVFVRDQQAAERAQNRRKSANEARRDRGRMLDNLSRSGAIPLTNSSANNASNRSLGAGSGISLASSSRRLMQPISQRGLGSTRLLGTEELPEQEAACTPVTSMPQQQQQQHPAMLQDTEALDSPNTRKERRKEKRRMKGAVRTLMATMRISSVTK